jgi:hypothetical protein
MRSTAITDVTAVVTTIAVTDRSARQGRRAEAPSHRLARTVGSPLLGPTHHTAAKWLAACAIAVWSARAEAQVGADVARRSLIDAAAAAARAGDHARALELGERALALRATPSLRLFLAREHLRAGHPVEALAQAGECATRARGDATVPDRDATLARCEAVAREAERGVARLTLRVASPAPAGLRVTVRGEVVAAALYDVAWPLAPGETSIDATAAGRVAFHRDLTLTVGASETVDVMLAEPEVVAPAVTPVVVAPPVIAPPVVVAPPRRERRAAPAPSRGPWVVVGVGVAGLVAGGVLGALALGEQSSRDAACPSAARCDAASALSHDAAMRDLGLGANVALVAGGALVVGGVAWWLIARATRTATPTPAGLALRW